MILAQISTDADSADTRSPVEPAFRPPTHIIFVAGSAGSLNALQRLFRTLAPASMPPC
jgi:hypothetical protein